MTHTNFVTNKIMQITIFLGFHLKKNFHQVYFVVTHAHKET